MRPGVAPSIEPKVRAVGLLAASVGLLAASVGLLAASVGLAASVADAKASPVALGALLMASLRLINRRSPVHSTPGVGPPPSAPPGDRSPCFGFKLAALGVELVIAQ